jgi:hypothetical protein
MGEVITFRGLAAQLKQPFHEQTLAENKNLCVSLAIWFQELFLSEPAEFWQKCYKHLDAVVQPQVLRLWMNYPELWEVPVALRGPGIDYSKIINLGRWTFNPVQTQPRGAIMPNYTMTDNTTVAEATTGPGNVGLYVRGFVQGPNGDGSIILVGWHRAYKKPVPSKTAIERCIRMCVLSRLVGRRLVSSTELLMAEARAFLDWALHKVGGDYPAGPGELQPVTTLSDAAKKVMRALLLDDEFVILVHQLPQRQDFTEAAWRRETENVWPEGKGKNAGIL